MSLAFDADVDVAAVAQFGAGPLDAGLTYPDDLTPFVRGARWIRGRSSTQGAFPAGKGVLLLDNSGGHFYSFDTASPYSPNVTSGVPFKLTATHNAVPYEQVYGYVESWDSAFPTNTEEVIAVPFVETYARLIRHRRSFTIAVQSTDARIGSLLTLGGWPAARRNLDSGVAEVAALDDEQSTVGFRLYETVIVEQGSIFQDRTGDVRFRNRVAYSGVTPSATFGPDAPDLVYTDVTYADNDALLYNEARVADSTGDVVTVIDDTSADVHGTITFPQVDSIEIPNQSVSLNVADWIVGTHQGLSKRVTGLTIDPAGDPANLWPIALGLDLRDAITVKIKFPGATDTFSQTLAVERVAHSFTPGGVWEVSYNLHPLSDFETQEYWQLGVAGSSELGVTTRLA